MAAPNLAFKVQCSDCSLFFFEWETQPVGKYVRRCYKCVQRQFDCISSFDSPPERCPLCNRKVLDMIAEKPGKPFHMFMHLIDGRFDLLCAPCSDIYIQKRADLYGNTPFGYAHKIR